MRIRLVVLAVLSICLTPFLVGQIIGAQKERADAVRNVEQGLRTSINRTRDFLMDVQADIENMASLIAVNDSFQRVPPAECSENLNKIRSMDKRIEHISIMTPKSVVYCSSISSAEGISAQGPSKHFKSTRQSNTFWGDIHYSIISNTVVISSVSVIKKNDKVEYLVVISLTLSALRNDIFDLFQVPLGKVILVNGKGETLDSAALDQPDLSFDQATINASSSIEAGIIAPRTKDEDASYIGVVKLPMNDARMLFSTPLKGVYSREDQKLGFAIVISLFEVIILAATVMTAIEIFFFRTLRKITKLASEITSGGQGQRISVKSPFPDFKVLASALNLMVERLDDASKLDALTGLANRRALNVHFEHCDRLLADEQATLAVAMIDIDGFKRFNDRFGHAAGDKALQQVGRTLRRVARRGTEIAARYGGEEFTLVLTITDAAKLYAYLDSVRQSVADLDIQHPDSPFGHITISIGYAIASAGMTMRQTVEMADAALYASKAAGRNRVTAAGSAQPIATAV